MPNWCYNHLRVEAEAKWNKDPEKTKKEQAKVEKELARFKKENILPNREKTGNFLSFEGSVPMPKSLKITSGSTTDRAIAYLLAKQDMYEEIDKIAEYAFAPKAYNFKVKDGKMTKRLKIIKAMEKEITKAELKEGQMALDNEKKYGHRDWYNWSIDNWGTKWDACEGSIDSEGKYELNFSFDTAWSPPTNWLQKVTERYPSLKFTLEYTEEGMGFEGKAFARDGQLVNNSMNIEYPDEFYA
tara:strand:+ start:123 stop:848 length:726 start_codon:yes stop_codon:yes gene_type:complete